MRARQPRKHMSHMGSTQMVTIDPALARKVMAARGQIHPAVIKMIQENRSKAKAAESRKYWLIGGGVALVAVVGGVLIYKSRSKNKG